MSAINVTPGSSIRVEVTSHPTNAAATKTLARLFRRDPEMARMQRHQQRKRPSYEEWQRGNRFWHHQMKTSSPIRVEPGVSYQMRATLDVIRDLESVSRFVKVSAV